MCLQALQNSHNGQNVADAAGEAAFGALCLSLWVPMSRLTRVGVVVGMLGGVAGRNGE